MPKIACYILFFIFVALYLGNSYPYHNEVVPLDTFHEGETLGMAVDYQNGKVPYKDTIFVHGVFSDPLRSVLAFDIFGRSISASRTFSSLLNVLAKLIFIIALYYILGKNIYYLAIFFGLFVIISVSHDAMRSLVHVRDISLYLFLIVAATLGNKIGTRVASPKTSLNILLFLWTFIPTFTFGVSIDRGFYLSFAALLTLIILYAAYWKDIRRYTLSVVLGYIVGFLTFGIMIKFAYFDFAQFSFFHMPKYKELMDGVIYPFTKIKYMVPVVIIAVSIYWLMYNFLYFEDNRNLDFIAKLKKFYSAFFMEILLCLLLVVFFRNALGRSDPGHVGYSLMPVYIFFSLILTKHYLRPAIEKLKFNRIITPTLASITILISMMAYYPSIRWNQLYALPNGMQDNKIIPASYIPAISFIRSNLNDDEYFFTMTSETTWYYFIDRPCPTKFPVVWFAMPFFYQAEIVEDLKSKNVKFILYKNANWSNSIDGFANEERLPIVFDYIRQHYTFGSLCVSGAS